MSASKNLYNKKTSFLSKSNSEFIEQMYLKFIKKDPELPKSWKDYFEDLDEEKNLVINEINGPSWKRTKRIDQTEVVEKKTIKDKKSEVVDKNISKKEKSQLPEEIKTNEEVKPKKSAKEWGRASNDPRNKT